MPIARSIACSRLGFVPQPNLQGVGLSFSHRRAIAPRDPRHKKPGFYELFGDNARFCQSNPVSGPQATIVPRQDAIANSRPDRMRSPI